MTTAVDPLSLAVFCVLAIVSTLVMLSPFVALFGWAVWRDNGYGIAAALAFGVFVWVPAMTVASLVWVLPLACSITGVPL